MAFGCVLGVCCNFLGISISLRMHRLQVPKLKVLMGSTYRPDLDPGDEKDPRAEAGFLEGKITWHSPQNVA